MCPRKVTLAPIFLSFLNLKLEISDALSANGFLEPDGGMYGGKKYGAGLRYKF